MFMSKQIDDTDDFDDLDKAVLERAWHEDMIKGFSKIANALSANNDREMIAAIKEQPQIFKLAMEQVIKSIPQPKVNAEFDYEKLVNVFKSISKNTEDKIEAATNKAIEAINTRLLPDTFTMVKGYGGITESVKVHYKQANQINKP